MKKRPKKMISLKRQLSRWFALVYVTAVAVALVLLGISISNYQQQVEATIQKNIELAERKMLSDIEQMRELVLQIYLKEDTFIDLKKEVGELQGYQKAYLLKKNMEMWIAMNPSVDGIFTYYNSGEEVVYCLEEKLGIDEKNKLLQNNQSVLKHETGTHEEMIQQIGDRIYYTIYCITGEASVFAITDLSDELIKQAGANDWYLTGIEELGMVFGSPEFQKEWKDANLTSQSEGKQLSGLKILYYNKVQPMDFGTVLILQNNLWHYFTVAHLLILALLIFSIYPAYRIYLLLQRQILQPLEDLTNNMRILQKGTWDIDIRENTNLEEIDNVNKTFAVMIHEIKDLKIQTYEEKSQRQRAQMQYLQLQLNPHFYVNCLKLIQAKVGLGDADHLEDFLVELSYHFRYLMKKGMQLVTVKEEIQFVENYLKLVRELYTGKVKECIYVDREAMKVSLPILAIQTFVENTIKYARKESQKELMILIQVKYMNVGEGEFLVISIKDNGIGYPEEMLPMLNNIRAVEEAGIGVFNLKKRIEIIYQKDYSWYFSNQGGASSELVLPCLREN